MKKFKIIGISLLMVMFLASCASIRGDIVAFSKEDLKNATTSRTVAKNLLKTWKLNSGFIRGALGTNIDQLPQQAIQAMNELDKLADKKDLNDYDLGYSLGLRIRALNSVVQEAIRIYAPNILDYLPALLKI